MEANKTILQMKYARIVPIFAAHTGITLEDAILYKRFSPSEQYGCCEGGRIHVIASLLAGAEVGTDQLSAPKHSFKREQQLGKIQEKRISHN